MNGSSRVDMINMQSPVESPRTVNSRTDLIGQAPLERSVDAKKLGAPEVTDGDDTRRFTSPNAKRLKANEEQKARNLSGKGKGNAKNSQRKDMNFDDSDDPGAPTYRDMNDEEHL